jgi:aldose 1-epimerase
MHSKPIPVTKTPFGRLPGGETATRYRLEAADGLAVEICDFGGTILRIEVPDAQGHSTNVALGFDSLDEYLAGSPFFGCLVGRYANRIAGGKFMLDGREVALTVNKERNGIPFQLHGGNAGFDKKLWASAIVGGDDGPAIELRLTSKDGEEGYPGTLDVKVRYLLTAERGLRIEYTARAAAPTPVNLTNHCYFNLEGEGTILDHRLRLAASAYTPVNEGLLPTGEIAQVGGTPMDFRTEQTIGSRINAPFGQLKLAGGYDHNYVLDDPGFALAAEVTAPRSGRRMQVWTDQPGVQFYSGNNLDGTLRASSGQPFVRHAGLCLETQHFPDSPNHPHFPSTILRPGEVFQSATEFRFPPAA